MHEGVIRDFLNLPGIAGIALIHPRSTPSPLNDTQVIFKQFDSALQIGQTERLMQEILQVVETIPESFETLEFPFATAQIRLYRGRPAKSLHPLSQYLLLVIARRAADALYHQRLAALKSSFMEVPDAAIAAFQTVSATFQTLPRSTTLASEPPALVSEPIVSEPIVSDSRLPALPLDPEHPTLQEVLSALNHLCQFTLQFLGPLVIVNYLRSSRPDGEWLQQFTPDRTAQLQFMGEPSALTQPLTPEQHQCLRAWVATFIRRCSQAVRDFSHAVDTIALTDVQKRLLLD